MNAEYIITAIATATLIFAMVYYYRITHKNNTKHEPH